jgi:hypothetical protein
MADVSRNASGHPLGGPRRPAFAEAYETNELYEKPVSMTFREYNRKLLA